MKQNEFKILIVDDQRFNLEVLSGILTSEQKDYTVITAKSGGEALRKAASERPDLILLDIVMPGMDGFEVLSELKKLDSARSIPVIIVTGLDKVEDEVKGFLYGAVDYIAKPFHPSLVLARVQTHLRIVEQMRIIEQLSLIDTLTNIPNRRSFDNRLAMEWKRAIREKTELSLMMIDVDRFKWFNDTYGHQQGDLALQTIAQVIESGIKRPGDLAARWGGEEFAVLLPNTGLAGALMLAEVIRAHIEKAVIPHLDDDASHLHATVSLGVSSINPTLGSSIKEFVGQADKALYVAKKSGRNRTCSYKEVV